MKFCPHCGGDLAKYMAADVAPSTARSAPVLEKYDQDSVWKELVTHAEQRRADPPDLSALALSAEDEFLALKPKLPAEAIVHIVFDRNIAPQGGALYRAARLQGRGTQPSIEQLAAMGYAVADGKILTVDDIPVSQAYAVLQYWGGDRQYRRWHLAAPVTVGPSRSGDPYFMDENMLAFGATWADFDGPFLGLLALLELFDRGVKGSSPVGRAIALKLLPR